MVNRPRTDPGHRLFATLSRPGTDSEFPPGVPQRQHPEANLQVMTADGARCKSAGSAYL